MVSRRISHLNNPNIRFIENSKLFIEADGTISPSKMHDYLHLTQSGYDLLGSLFISHLDGQD